MFKCLIVDKNKDSNNNWVIYIYMYIDMAVQTSNQTQGFWYMQFSLKSVVFYGHICVCSYGFSKDFCACKAIIL